MQSLVNKDHNKSTISTQYYIACLSSVHTDLLCLCILSAVHLTFFFRNCCVEIVYTSCWSHVIRAQIYEVYIQGQTLGGVLTGAKFNGVSNWLILIQWMHVQSILSMLLEQAPWLSRVWRYAFK